MSKRTMISTAAAPAAHPGRYQEALRRLAVVTLLVSLPGAGAVVRVWPARSRAQRSWPPGVSR